VATCLPWSTAIASTGLPCRYEIAHVIEVPPCIVPNGVSGTGISPNGRYVCGGLSHCDDGFVFVFDTHSGVLTEIPLPAGVTQAYPVDITDTGLMVGEIVGPDSWNGFVYDLSLGAFTATLEPAVRGGRCHVAGINRDGVVCGTRSVINPLEFLRTAYIWSANDGFTDVGFIDGCSTFGNDISDSGVMVGSMCSQSPDHDSVRGLVFDNGTITILDVVPDGFSSTAYEVNASGIIITGGMLQEDPLVTHTFVLESGKSTLLTIPPRMDRCGAVNVTNGGLIGGNCLILAMPEPRHPFIWKGDQFLAVSPNLPPGMRMDRANDMSDDGTMVLQLARIQDGNGIGAIARPAWPEPGDVNCDETVNVNDILDVIRTWGPCPSGCATDLDENYVTNVGDLMIVLSNWG